MKILIIGSTHKEGGLCTSNELCKILEQVLPDVIFLEVPPDKFNQVFEGQISDSLETSAVKKYLISHQSELIPVDVERLPKREKYRKMLNTFNNNPEYDRVSSEYSYLGQVYGFKFLNSRKADQMQDYLHFLESEIIKMAGKQEFSKDYEDWQSVHDKRENHWIKSINTMAKDKENLKAVFLVGSAHRNRLKEKVDNLQQDNRSGLHWNFYPFK